MRACRTITLTELNEHFSNWLKVDYHQTAHSDTAQSPYDRHNSDRKITRIVGMDAIVPIFHRRVQRKVDPVHSDIRLHGALYRVDPQYRTFQVWAIYDPFTIESSVPEQVEIWSQQGVYLGIAERYARQRGAHHQQPTLPPPQKLEDSAYFRALQAEAEKQQQSERQDGTNFHNAMAHGRLTLTGLCQCMARSLGHKGGLSEFTAEELHALQRLNQDHPHVLQSHVRTAFERVTSADFTSVLWELQQLLADMKGTD